MVSIVDWSQTTWETITLSVAFLIVGHNGRHGLAIDDTLRYATKLSNSAVRKTNREDFAQIALF